MVIQEDGTYFYERSGDYIVNLGNVVNVRLTTDFHRTNDCWQPHCIVFDPTTTAQVPE
jgi:hypothetical protein